jgi:Leucine-rich repeat (LRR) protein
MSHLLIALLLASSWPAFCAELNPQDVASWIVAQGGSVETDSTSHVTAVNLGFKWVTDGDLEKVVTLKTLRKLDLSFSLITDAGMERLKPLTGITDLNLFAVEKITDTGLSYIRGWKKLERLNLHGTDVTDITMQQYVSEMPSLRSLDIGYTLVGNLGIEALASLPSIENLVIGGNKIDGGALHVLELLPKLAELDLSGKQNRNGAIWTAVVTDFDLKVIGGLKQLRSLNIAGLNISDLGVSQLKTITGLQSLDLSRTQVTNKVFDTLIQLQNLERLSLWRVKRIDDGAAAQIAGLKHVNTLDLSETAITDHALEQMAGMKQLRRLYLSGSKVTSAGLEAFRRAVPQCEVSFN